MPTIQILVLSTMVYNHQLRWICCWTWCKFISRNVYPKLIVCFCWVNKEYERFYCHPLVWIHGNILIVIVHDHWIYPWKHWASTVNVISYADPGLCVGCMRIVTWQGHVFSLPKVFDQECFCPKQKRNFGGNKRRFSGDIALSFFQSV